MNVMYPNCNKKDEITQRSAVLRVQNITTGYGKALVLREISVEAYSGEIVALLGPNGAGKTTFMRAVMGLVPCWTGKIFLQADEITNLPPEIRVSMGLGYCPEGRNIFANLTVIENLYVGGHTVQNKRKLKENLEEVFSLFPRLKARSRQIAGSLSGGEQQMLAIGRALMSNPTILLLDEPSLGLAPLLVEEIYRKVKQISKEKDVTLIMVEQNVDIALEVANRGYVLEKGEITLSGSSAELWGHPFVQRSYLGIKTGG